MIDPACPTKEEVDLLKQHYRKGRGTVSQRAHAILLSSLGKTACDIAQVLFVEEKTVREWIKRWLGIRMASLFSDNHGNQNASKLTDRQREEIARVLKQAPGDYGIPREFWDVSSLRFYVTAHFNVVYESSRSYHFLFRVNDFSFKLPSPFDLRRNEKAVEKRIKEIQRMTAPFKRDPTWVLLAGDETRITWEAIVRRVWLPKGEKSILKVHREHEAQNFLGFVNLKTGTPHLYPIAWQNQREIIKVLKVIQKKYTGKRICLVWDNAKFHKGNLIRKALEHTLSSFFLINFPPYAPDTNPQEHVWQWSKDQVANVQFHSLKDLVRTFRRIVMGRKYAYQI